MVNFNHWTANKEPKVKVLTYNIWFEQVVHERLDAVLSIIEQADADFICLQEMTKNIYKYFVKSPYIATILREGGSISRNEIGSYGTMIISKFPCHYFECDFRSRMGRKLILAEPCLPFHLIVASSHFESLNSAEVRREQLKTTFDVLKAAQGAEFPGHSVLVGDFNFDVLKQPLRE